MTSDELNAVMHEWEINAAQFAKVLCLHTNKMSEYLGGIERILYAIEFSIDALKRLPTSEFMELIKQRINRRAYS